MIIFSFKQKTPPLIFAGETEITRFQSQIVE